MTGKTSSAIADRMAIPTAVPLVGSGSVFSGLSVVHCILLLNKGRKLIVLQDIFWNLMVFFLFLIFFEGFVNAMVLC